MAPSEPSSAERQHAENPRHTQRAMPLHRSSLFHIPPAFPPPSDLRARTFPLLVTAGDTEGYFHIQSVQPGKGMNSERAPNTPTHHTPFPWYLQLLIHCAAHSAVPRAEQMIGLIPQVFVTAFDNRLNTKRAGWNHLEK